MGESGEMAPHTGLTHSAVQTAPSRLRGSRKGSRVFPPRGHTGLRRIWQLLFPPFLFKTTSSFSLLCVEP